MIRELDTVVLARDLEAYGLKRGDVGAVVHCYTDGKAFEVEFVTGEGKTIAVVTLAASDIRRCAARRFFTCALLRRHRNRPDSCPILSSCLWLTSLPWNMIPC